MFDFADHRTLNNLDGQCYLGSVCNYFYCNYKENIGRKMYSIKRKKYQQFDPQNKKKHVTNYNFFNC